MAYFFSVVLRSPNRLHSYKCTDILGTYNGFYRTIPSVLPFPLTTFFPFFIILSQKLYCFCWCGCELKVISSSVLLWKNELGRRRKGEEVIFFLSQVDIMSPERQNTLYIPTTSYSFVWRSISTTAAEYTYIFGPKASWIGRRWL